jgi:hypothetical protein
MLSSSTPSKIPLPFAADVPATVELRGASWHSASLIFSSQCSVPDRGGSIGENVMRNLLTFLIALAAIALGVCTPASAQSIGFRTAILSKPPAAAYKGPGDVTTWQVFWSLRAYSAATRGTKLANVCNSTGGVDVGCADMLSDAVTGNLVSATVSGITCPGANCTVKTLYDQVGTFCSGPCDVTNATVANRPTLTANCVNTTLPCMTFVAANSQFLHTASTAPVQAQPLTLSWVANHTGGTSGSIGLQSGSGLFLNYGGSNQVQLNAGVTLGPVTASDGAWHSIQGVATTTPNSVISVDNVETTGNAGTNGINSADFLNLGAFTGGSSFFGGTITEFGIDFAVHSGTLRTSMCHNQFTYWGTSTSC